MVIESNKTYNLVIRHLGSNRRIVEAINEVVGIANDATSDIVYLYKNALTREYYYEFKGSYYISGGFMVDKNLALLERYLVRKKLILFLK